ncbi:matrix metalloproteinase-2 isoform X1 [Lepeophtheirus salmonis]|uniref:matrix metalloproteinase-2 isoform X1 n=1 Tax=Lepeophtheirus salmonis TaxID=72036 RepID=UPI001AE8D81A|nr:matrix metalloproteinase-2-like [Lepeophtheirus salmonis]XP_040575021.1 matrix metalloproteinase-2-like [Lepeophtheirus salmonis]XP_040575022.1 matrix metalloproteinase-2-like [Lepeophtheirus salmonis]XP_040575023.1 matrix metalloproteinase-2-like [Lepeophtheirus salmonis]XP_040575024.1 matrix metalloproteinase-2-like [Lepeophtheirus salmonis]
MCGTSSIFSSLMFTATLLILPECLLGSSDIVSSKLENYLTSFGYLPSSPDNGPFAVKPLRTESQIRNAIRNLQFFAGLKATGKVDKATVKLLSKPRCGVSDVSHGGYRNKRSLRRVKRVGNIQGERWSTTDITWNLKPLSSKKDSSGIEEGVIRRELSSALSLWSKDSALNFKEINGNDKADIEMSFEKLNHGDGYPFDGPGSVLAHAFFPGNSRGGDIHFDAAEIWTSKRASHLSRDGVASIYGVALHEVGHSLGLSHSPIETSIMFPWYSQSEKLVHLPPSDRLAVQHLYGESKHRSSNPDPKSPPETIPRRAIPTPKTTTTTTRSSVRSKTNPPVTEPPINKCNTSFDAISIIRSEIWAFKGKHFWRIHDVNHPPEHPTEISSFWYTLPRGLKGIDALYERQDHRILMFVGDSYYVLKGNTQLEAGPIPLTDLGLPHTVRKIDGAFRWGWNSKTFFFAGHQYWRFDDDERRVELDYPRNISKVWQGVPSHIDSVFTATNGKTFFFKDSVYYPFNDQGMRIEKELPISSFWSDCAVSGNMANPFSTNPNIDKDSSGAMLRGCPLLLLVISLLYLS